MKKDYLPVSMEENLGQWEQDNHVAALGSYCVHRALACYYFGEYEETERELIRGEKFLSGFTNSILKREWHVFRVLNALKLYEKGTGFKTKRELMAEIRPIITKIEKWAGFGPVFIEYLMKSSLAISAEIEQKVLLKKIMNVVIESSGAQHGYLLIEDAGKLFVRAESHVTEKETAQTLNQKLEDAKGICKAIVRYVQRTGEKVILKDACQEGMFKDNPEVQEMQLRSVLCLPVVKQSRMFGKLYLENRLAGSVFTPEKIQMTELVASQAAISLDNAQLVEDIKRAKDEWELTFNTVPDLMMILDKEHRIVRVNKSTADRLRLAPEQCTGVHCYEAVHGLSHPPEFCPHALTCQDGKEHSTDVHEPRLGGDFLVSTTPMLDGEGELIGSIHIARDITERKRAEEELHKAHDESELRVQERTRELTEANRMLQAEMAERERAQQAITAERQRFNEVLDMLPVYTVLLTPDHHVPFANRFFEKRFGESHGNRCFEYLFGRTEPCEVCETYTVLKTKEPHHWEWLGPDKHNYDIFDFPFTDTDGSALILEVGVDITEVKRAEAAL